MKENIFYFSLPQKSGKQGGGISAFCSIDKPTQAQKQTPFGRFLILSLPSSLRKYIIEISYFQDAIKRRQSDSE